VAQFSYRSTPSAVLQSHPDSHYTAGNIYVPIHHCSTSNYLVPGQDMYPPCTTPLWVHHAHNPTLGLHAPIPIAGIAEDVNAKMPTTNPSPPWDRREDLANASASLSVVDRVASPNMTKPEQEVVCLNPPVTSC
jgi:hypothetical protein